MSGLLQVVDASTTTASGCGSTTSKSVESGTADRISRVQASSTASRRSETASKSRSSNVPTAATRVRNTARFSNLAATRSSTDPSPRVCPLLVFATWAIGPPGNFEATLPQADSQLTTGTLITRTHQRVATRRAG